MPSTRDPHRDRAALKEIASSTLKAIKYGGYRVDDVPHELHFQTAVQDTRFFGPNPSSDLANWRSPAHVQSDNRQTQISIVEISAIDCCGVLAAALRRDPLGGENIKIGVLNVASATNPGGDFMDGAQGQEESITRSSTLYPTLRTDVAQKFYYSHNHHSSNSFHTHAMIYSPGVEIFRDDEGGWTKPIMVDVLTCAAVDAGEVRESRLVGSIGRQEMEDNIQSAMRERMARSLYLFEEMGIRNIVLGSFGTGVYGNDVDVVAKIWADLLSVPSARFKGSFDRVMFAIMGRKTFVEFQEGFNGQQSNLIRKLGPVGSMMSSTHDPHRDRAALKEIASSTLKAIEYGEYRVDDVPHELHFRTAVQDTRFFRSGSSSDLANWRSPAHAQPGNRQTQISIVEISTIHCCGLLAAALRRDPSGVENIKIGVLNFASATKPGGGFLKGAQAQEESIARSSTLYPTLLSDVAQEFYRLHNHHSSNSFYTHAMIYSPGVEIFRDDEGRWTKPIMVDVLTCAAVDAGEVRESRQGFTGRREQEDSIQSVMRERMGRILYLFEKMGVRNIVLGSVGTGIFGNDVDVVANIWVDLLSVRSARFKGSFDRVLFAIMGRKTFIGFEEGFKGQRSIFDSRNSIKLCNYCHKQPKAENEPHCGAICREMAKSACLMCRNRPKHGRYHFCGRTCRDDASKLSPLILEVPKGHTTFDMVEGKFQQSWRNSQPCPSVKRVYKVVESSNFRIPYDRYKDQHGNESFRYHGTERSCRLGDDGHTKLCKSSSCAACSILETSFQVSLANPGGAFGQGVYTSSASNKSASYSKGGVMFLAKVVLGNVRNVTEFEEVKSCPRGYQSVVFDRMNGRLNETVVYTNEAIRPVFLMIFG